MPKWKCSWVSLVLRVNLKWGELPYDIFNYLLFSPFDCLIDWFYFVKRRYFFSFIFTIEWNKFDVLKVRQWKRVVMVGQDCILVMRFHGWNRLFLTIFVKFLVSCKRHTSLYSGLNTLQICSDLRRVKNLRKWLGNICRYYVQWKPSSTYIDVHVCMAHTEPYQSYQWQKIDKNDLCEWRKKSYWKCNTLLLVLHVHECFSLTKWHEVCHNAPYAILEVLHAWEAGALTAETVKVLACYRLVYQLKTLNLDFLWAIKMFRRRISVQGPADPFWNSTDYSLARYILHRLHTVKSVSYQKIGLSGPDYQAWQWQMF